MEPYLIIIHTLLPVAVFLAGFFTGRKFSETVNTVNMDVHSHEHRTD